MKQKARKRMHRKIGRLGVLDHSHVHAHLMLGLVKAEPLFMIETPQAHATCYLIWGQKWKREID